MADFLKECFLTFKVAFWDSKSAQYMADVVPVMLGRVKGQHSCVPCFVWSAQDCEPIDQGCHADDNGRTDGRTDGRSDDGRWVVRDLDTL
jgi:hypothetical protein